MEGVDYVFHAAALKQVPSCEFYPLEAVQTNVLGADNVLTAAIQAGVQSVVVLSTDKAAYPINAMGMSKGLMEKVTIARSRVAADKGCTLCVTRYGNVMASRGSVIPLFVDQIRQGLPLTVTDPNMTRFMMSLDDAVDLVVYAFQNAAAGRSVRRKGPGRHDRHAGRGRQAGLRRRQLRSSVIGTRHGEKLYETLLTREEMARAERPGRLLPRAGRHPRPELRQVFFRRRKPSGRSRRLPLAQRAAARRRRDGRAAVEAALHPGAIGRPDACSTRLRRDRVERSTGRKSCRLSRMAATTVRSRIVKNRPDYRRQGVHRPQPGGTPERCATTCGCWLTILDNTEAELRDWAGQADVIFHLAGVNRPQDPAEFESGNAGTVENSAAFSPSWAARRR